MAGLSLQGVSKSFGGNVAVDNVDLEIADGEFLALLGPSGCGKTTMLRLVAGFERANRGKIAIGGKVVSGPGVHVPAENRRVGIVFQSYALWPHMSVARNVGYPLEVAGVEREAYSRRIASALETVGLSGFGERRPAELSGGQRQRVALARCLVMEPSLVLFDEPLANLDVHLRAAMEVEFIRFHRATGSTALYITHDQAEAMALADRIAVMDRGRIVQVDAPRTLYRQPATPMIASFIGEGCVTDCEVIGLDGPGQAHVRILGTEVSVRAEGTAAAGPGRLCVRPENLALRPEGTGIPGEVRRVVYTGGQNHLEVIPAADPEVTLKLRTGDEQVPREGESLRFALTGGWLIPGRDVGP